MSMSMINLRWIRAHTHNICYMFVSNYVANDTRIIHFIKQNSAVFVYVVHMCAHFSRLLMLMLIFGNLWMDKNAFCSLNRMIEEEEKNMCQLTLQAVVSTVRPNFLLIWFSRLFFNNISSLSFWFISYFPNYILMLWPIFFALKNFKSAKFGQDSVAQKEFVSKAVWKTETKRSKTK